MKMIKRVAMSAAALVFIGSSVFAQSLADAKKAIDAEQYQKAKSMLKNLTVTQPTNDENQFYLGWVYIKQDYVDSAKAAFNKGISVNPKSALNYVGLGAVARLTKDAAGASTNFNQALALAGKTLPAYLYVGKSYLLPIPPAAVISQADGDAAIAVLEKSKTVNTKQKDAEIFVTLGDAYLTQLKSNEASSNYQEALATDPKSLTANVHQGALWKLANNWEAAATQFKAALAIDPNFGPAYREWAETDLRQAKNDIKVAAEKVHEAVDYYKKYLSLTDMSLESQMRYADFLVNAGDWKTLQDLATGLSKYAATNLRIYRYLAIAAYENKDYTTGISAMNKWLASAGESRILPIDYLYQGRLKLAANDSTGVDALRKAYQLDSTKTDVFLEIAKNAQDRKKYLEAANAYQEYFDKPHKGLLIQEHFYQGRDYFNAFQYVPAGAKQDSALLTKSDSAFSYVSAKLGRPFPAAIQYRAYIADYRDADRNNIKGLARPFYEQLITLLTAKPNPTDQDKKDLVEAYLYLARIYEYKDKDDAKTLDAYTKAQALDPTNKDVVAYFAKKPGAKPAK